MVQRDAPCRQRLAERDGQDPLGAVERLRREDRAIGGVQDGQHALPFEPAQRPGQDVAPERLLVAGEGGKHWPEGGRLEYGGEHDAISQSPVAAATAIPEAR